MIASIAVQEAAWLSAALLPSWKHAKSHQYLSVLHLLDWPGKQGLLKVTTGCKV
jgi:hypothetical protein